ncbi:hypothetical protein AMTR_s00030p00165030 [Amborella trichopoda]|uniref:BTB domain-containing protein n=2 Tax=Amborella trichopoda TaxID=13333 RepID=U5D6X0_AMBTC|nr:hypothetical protein AMTR_s00030p00165030 [Amborella trichopoda]
MLRLLYLPEESVTEAWHSVRSTLGILRAALCLGCTHIVNGCVEYLEAVPWEEAEEDEILEVIPSLGPRAEPVLARLQPVEPIVRNRVFLSALRLATSRNPCEPKSTAQEQLDYMLTDDDDLPLVKPDGQIKVEIQKCMDDLFVRFSDGLSSTLRKPEDSFEASEVQLLGDLADLVWACRVLPKLDMMKGFVHEWYTVSDEVLRLVGYERLASCAGVMKLKVIEVAARVLEAVAYGTVILPAPKRLRLVKTWLPFVRKTKPELDVEADGEKEGEKENQGVCKMDAELCQSIESAFVSLVLALPSGDQADILADWLKDDQVRFPDLSEAFEVWCYRSKKAKRRLSLGLSGSATGTALSH